VLRLSSNHVPALDGLRGLALLAVLFSHLADFLPDGAGAGNAIKTAMRGGWCGVDLFFVLSGFLITGILLDTKEAPNYFSSFYARRALRIFPLYYLVLTTTMLLAALTGRPAHAFPLMYDRIFYFFYLNNWWPLLHDTWHTNIIGHFWSLAVEEQFYALWPLCILLIPNKKVIPVALCGMLLALLLRIWIYLESGETRTMIENTFTRMDALLMGALIAALVRDYQLLVRYRRLIYAVALICGSAALLGHLKGVVLFSLLAVLFGGVVLHAFEKGNAVFNFQPLRMVGKYSYGMYVYHVPLIFFVRGLIGEQIGLGKNWPGSWLFLLAMVMLTFAVAAISFNLFESRFLKLKRSFTPNVRFLEAEASNGRNAVTRQ
jgi:peptidoglycan/LPS O-acetylase OafA/YrhL